MKKKYQQAFYQFHLLDLRLSEEADFTIEKFVLEYHQMIVDIIPITDQNVRNRKIQLRGDN